MNPFDEPATETDELPRMEAIADAPAALPRLSIIHLLMWTAATAVAFLPYQLWASLQAKRDSSSEYYLSTVSTIANSVHGIATGGHLFVVAALLFWKGRGWASTPLQPGHWLAIRGATGIVVTLMAGVALYAFGQPTTAATRLLAVPYFLVYICFFLVFLWLAIRRNDPARWRITFLVMAIAPLVGWIPTALWAYILSPTAYLSGPGIAAAVQALVLLTTLGGDLASRTERHWTHWIACWLYAVALMATAALYLAYTLAYAAGQRM
jgi:hypothetical protein